MRIGAVEVIKNPDSNFLHLRRYKRRHSVRMSKFHAIYIKLNPQQGDQYAWR